MKNSRLIVVVLLILGLLGFFAIKHQTTSSACGPYRNDKTVQISTIKFKAEVADTSNQQQQGLGGRPCILPNQAMLFEFAKPSHYSFWMKDMKFPIDIIWIGPDHKVAGLEVDVKPSTYPDRFVNKDRLAQYVLEIQANRSKDLNIRLGTPVNF